MNRTATLLVLLGCLLPTACGERAAPLDEPARSALRLFELARIEEPSAADLELFSIGSDLRDRAALLDALARVARTSSVELVEVQSVGEDTFADLITDMEGGSAARFSVRLRPVDAQSWQVTWFQGPGVEWPPAAPTTGESLSTSMP